jgi:outer membrane protein
MRSSLLFILFSFLALGAQAQRFGIVDTQYILSKIPEYSQAQSQLDQMSKTWQGEVEALLSEADALQKSLDAERILLTDEMAEEREKVISEKEQEARKLQRQYFGPEGDLFKKRQELVKPIQDQVYNAVQDVASKKRLDVVFDKASSLTMLYASDKIDISEDVLSELGY